MIINITYKTTIETVQQKFRTAYPFLKIEFCSGTEAEGKRVSRQHFCDENIKLLDIAKKLRPGWVVMHPWHTVRYLREIFKTGFGVHAAFFRKEHDQWIEILGTDGFELVEQNEIGREVLERQHEVYRPQRELLF